MLRFGEKYGTGLLVDFNTGLATIQSVLETGRQSMESSEKHERRDKPSAYHDAGLGASISSRTWKSCMEIEKLELYDVGGRAAQPSKEKSSILS